MHVAPAADARRRKRKASTAAKDEVAVAEALAMFR